MHVSIYRFAVSFFLFAACASFAEAAELPIGAVEGQPLAANVTRAVEALEYLGHPLSPALCTHSPDCHVDRQIRTASQV